jgi:Flp pilus assembly protein TadG
VSSEARRELISAAFHKTRDQQLVNAEKEDSSAESSDNDTTVMEETSVGTFYYTSDSAHARLRVVMSYTPTISLQRSQSIKLEIQ